MNLEPAVLIQSDDEKYSEILKETLTEAEYQVVCNRNSQDSLRYLREGKIFLVIFSIKKLTDEYIDILKTIKQNFPFIEVLFIVMWPSANSAYKASLLGAYEYLARTPELTDYIKVVDNIFKEVKNRYRNSSVPWVNNAATAEFLPQIIGKHPRMQSVLEKVQKAAHSDLPGLILGETGVGKELIAQMMHKKSPRKEKPFIAVNCAALPDTLLENELFGHEKGAFTNATSTKMGLIEEAHTGTIFLDEIGEMSPLLQTKLLRVLETGLLRRLGGAGKEIRVDVRIISATNKDLYAEVQNNRFRADFYYRLAVVNFEIPPLRDRKEDIPLLVEHFLDIADKYGKLGPYKLTSSAMRMLVEHDYPGNVRELKNYVERLVVLCAGNSISPGDIAEIIPNLCASTAFVEKLGKSQKGRPAPAYARPSSLEEMEKKHIKNVFEITGGDHEKCAEMLGISGHSLAEKLKQYNMIKTQAYE